MVDGRVVSSDVVRGDLRSPRHTAFPLISSGISWRVKVVGA
jgi:hypothetical protein